MVTKSKLTDFISKYFLAGATDSAKLEVKDGKLSTDFITSDSVVLGTIETAIDLPDGVLGIFATSQLIKLLGALDSQIDVKYELDNKSGNPYCINMSDTTTKVTYQLADLSVIKPRPPLKSLPEFEVTIKLDKAFSNNFKKSVAALPEAENFGVIVEDGTPKIVINYSTINNNRVIFNAIASDSDVNKFDPVCFSAKLFREVLNSNSDIEGTLEVSSRGLARVTFKDSDTSAVYYLIKLTIT